MTQPRKSKWLLVALVTGVVVLTLAGLGLLGAYFYLSRQVEAKIEWISPLAATRSQQVAPDLAVLALAGEPDDRVIRAALDAGEIETAYAGLAYGVLVPDSLRGGHWLLLTDEYRTTDPARAAIAVQAALDVAALSPLLGDMARADISLQAATRLIALNRPAVARLALAQAESIARYSPLLLPAQRRSVLERLEATYRVLKDDVLAGAVRKDLDAASNGPGVKLDPPPSLLPALRGSITLSPQVIEKTAARQRAAAEMAARWLTAPPSGRTALAEALGNALSAEDAVRQEFYATAAELSDQDRLAMMHDRIAWLTIKYRTARNAFGAPLVPDWSGQADEIQTELSKAYTDLINGYGQQLDTLASAEASQARVELLRQGLLATRLGLFPDPAAEKLLSDQLIVASSDLWTRQGSIGLVNSVQQVQGQPYYLLSGSDAKPSTPAPKP